MSRAWSILLLGLGPCCYLMKLPYLFDAWRNSPLDRADGLALPLALTAAGIAAYHAAKPRISRIEVSVRMLAPGVALLFFVLAQTYSVNALAVLAAAAFWWSCGFAALSPMCADALLPAFLTLCLGCPGSTYWLGHLLEISTGMVWLLKAAAAAALLTLTILRIRIKPELPAFILCFLAGMIFRYDTNALRRTSEPLRLDMEREQTGCLVRAVQPNPVSRHFFRNSVIRNYLIADRDGGGHLLEIRKVGDIHEIHPAGHCLRSSGREILSEEVRELRIGRRRIPVTLIRTRSRGGGELFAVWYSTPALSCGRFLAFRRLWRAAEDWRIYQFSTPIKNSADDPVRRTEAIITRFAVPRER